MNNPIEHQHSEAHQNWLRIKQEIADAEALLQMKLGRTILIQQNSSGGWNARPWSNGVYGKKLLRRAAPTIAALVAELV